jgi:hypothetical protein
MQQFLGSDGFSLALLALIDRHCGVVGHPFRIRADELQLVVDVADVLRCWNFLDLL